ncbi:carboxypeptidase-like regulatory domain-containing protein [Actinoplanes xinjiangensis]|uniref:carboxypeptidase-like regulatory domain-containing protein n=1 Tax=Actinoplanes xinjiangensis TaxID=512350 RepID=UPI003428F992
MRLRARWAAAVAVIGLTGATLAVSPAPVAAAPAPIGILSVSAENVRPGDKVRVRFRVTNTGRAAETAIVVVGGGLRCTTGCRAEPSLGPGRSRDFEATVVAPEAGQGETTGLNISVAVRLGGQNSFDYKMVYVHGPGTEVPGAEQPSSVDRVSGRVRDADGEAISGASVTVRDSAGHEYRTTSDRNGRFVVRSTAGKPIAEGSITVVVAGDGYRTGRKTVRGVAGDTASVQLKLAAAVTPSATSPSPRAEASPLAAADETPGSPTIAAAPADPGLRTVSDEGNGTLLFTGLGGLLVAVGVGALLLMVLRRRKASAEPVPAAATQLMPPVGTGLADPPTVVLPAPRLSGRYGTPPQGGTR